MTHCLGRFSGVSLCGRHQGDQETGKRNIVLRDLTPFSSFFVKNVKGFSTASQAPIGGVFAGDFAYLFIFWIFDVDWYSGEVFGGRFT